MVEVEEEKIKTIQNQVREIINWIAVEQEEEKEAGTQKIEDEAAKLLREKLEKLSADLDALMA